MKKRRPKRRCWKVLVGKDGKKVHIAPNGRPVRDLAAYGVRMRRNFAANDVVHDQTAQRRFERRFESRDLRGSRAARADAAAKTAAWELWDNPWDGATFYTRRIRLAIEFLRKELGFKSEDEHHCALRTLLWCVYRNGKRGREATLEKTGLTEGRYYGRLDYYTSRLGAKWTRMVEKNKKN